MASSLLTYLRPEVAALKARLDQFVEEECVPAEEEFAQHVAQFKTVEERFSSSAVPPCLERLKTRARQLGLWNLFIPPRLLPHVPRTDLRPAIPLSYREYGILCESLGRCPHVAPEACNSSAPDTGNMEVLLEFGTPQQQREYLVPLMKGEIRSAFLMTEPAVASSDPTNLQTQLLKKRDGTYVLNGEKWWSTGAMDPRTRFALVVARMEYEDQENDTTDESNNKHGAHTIVLVPLPHPGVTFKRALTLFGYDDAPSGHAHVQLNNVQLTRDHLIDGEGSGFRVSQARLGPGRIHHCMRAIGMGK